MAVKHVQCGIQNHRTNRVPLDADFVMTSYADLRLRTDTDMSPEGTAYGSFYPGLYTAVTDDPDTSYNGPWYISKEAGKAGYRAERLASTYELNAGITYIQKQVDDFKAYMQTEVNNKIAHVEEEVYDVIFGWGHL